MRASGGPPHASVHLTERPSRSRLLHARTLSLEDLNALFAQEARTRHDLLVCRSPQMRRSLLRQLVALTDRIAVFRAARLAPVFPVLGSC